MVTAGPATFRAWRLLLLLGSTDNRDTAGRSCSPLPARFPSRLIPTPSWWCCSHPTAPPPPPAPQVLGKGELPAQPLVVKAKFFSSLAEKKIRAAGGDCILTA